MKRDIADTIADCLIEDHIELMKENESLKAELAEAKRDAERYRWLRECGEEYCDLRIFDSRGNINPDSLDAAIDAAIKGKS